MITPTAVAQTSFYDIGGHLMYFTLITAHICLFIDESPLQKHPLCSFNFILAMLASAGICSVMVDYLTFPSFLVETLVGLGVAVVSSLAMTLSIQRWLNIQLNL